jgi:hypothetical protein
MRLIVSFMRNIVVTLRYGAVDDPDVRENKIAPGRK